MDGKIRWKYFDLNPVCFRKKIKRLQQVRITASSKPEMNITKPDRIWQRPKSSANPSDLLLTDDIISE
jgi:hypothetical protein